MTTFDAHPSRARWARRLLALLAAPAIALALAGCGGGGGGGSGHPLGAEKPVMRCAP